MECEDYAGGGGEVKAIIITDMDARALLDKLKLESMYENNHFRRTDFDKPASVEDVHRAFHYVVCRWLQEQGADIVGR